MGQCQAAETGNRLVPGISMSKTPGSEPEGNLESGDVPTVSVVSINPIRSMSNAWRQAVAQGAHRFRQLREVVRLTPFDVSTPEGQSRERYRRVALTTITSVIAKSVALLTMLISVPLTVNYLGTERFGLWMTVSSLVAFLGFADFGIGNGLLNGIAEASGKDDAIRARKYVSSASFLMLGMGVFLVLLQFVISPWIRWERVFNLTSAQAVREAEPAVAVFIGCFALNLVLGTVQRVQLGYQEGFVSNLWQILGSVAGLIGVMIVIHFRGGLPWLVAAMAGAPALAAGLNWIQFFTGRGAPLLPRTSCFDWSTARNLVSVGFVFMLLNVLAQNWSQSDNLIIARVLGADAVPGYAVVQKLFSITMLAQFAVMPLWPAYGEALARADVAWARRTLNRALCISLLVTIALSLPLVVFGKTIVTHWAGAELVAGFPLLLGVAVLNVLFVIAVNLSTLLVHGANLRGQLAFYTVASLTALALKILFARWFGVAGVVWGTVLAFGLIYTPLALRLAYRAVNPK